MTTSNIQVHFANEREIRMGSPFMSAELTITGIELLLPEMCWQNKYALSGDKKWIVLIAFNLASNEPGFILYVINTETKNIRFTHRIMGLVKDVSIEQEVIKINKFLYDKGKSEYGNLCCDIEEEISLSSIILI